MTEIVRIARADIVYEPHVWPFAVDRRNEIERHFAERCRARPGIWNGRVLMLHRHRFVGSEFHGACFETDYASFLSWRDWGSPDRNVAHYFAVPALRTSDGAFLLGEMGAHTAAAGRVYFPCGTPEPADLVNGRVDLAAGMRREFAEETGLDMDAFAAEADWVAVIDGPHIALLKPLQARENADQIGARVRRHLACAAQPELAAVHFVRAAAHLDRPLPAFVRAFLADSARRHG
jgi:hypothetical protein